MSGWLDVSAPLFCRGNEIFNIVVIDKWFDWLLVFNANFSNISAISWRPVLVVEEAGVRTRREPPTMGKYSKLHHLRLQSRARTHAVLMIGLYELLGNPTT